MKKLLFAMVFGLAACSSPAPEPEGNDQLATGQLQSSVPQPESAAAVGERDAIARQAEATPDPAAIEAAKAAIKAEPKVKDMLYQGKEAVQWQIGVLDDGSKRFGYALYVCQLLREHKVLTGRTHVRIVDIAKVHQGEDFRSASLGHVVCETGDILNP